MTNEKRILRFIEQSDFQYGVYLHFLFLLQSGNQTPRIKCPIWNVMGNYRKKGKFMHSGGRLQSFQVLFERARKFNKCDLESVRPLVSPLASCWGHKINLSKTLMANSGLTMNETFLCARTSACSIISFNLDSAFKGASQVALWWRIHLPMQETQKMQVWSLDGEDPRRRKWQLTPHSKILAWKIPWTEETGRPYSIGVIKSGTQLSTHTHTHTFK